MKFFLILALIFLPIQIYGQIYTIQVNEYQSNGWEHVVRLDPFTDEKISTVSKAAKDGPDLQPRVRRMCAQWMHRSG